MKRILAILAVWLVPAMLLAQGNSPFRPQYATNVAYHICHTLEASDTIELTDYGTIYSFAIDATIYQPRETSFVRIVLEDKEGNDYIVAESDRMRNDDEKVVFSSYCEETAILNGIVPVRLKCYLRQSTVSIHAISTATMRIDNRGGMYIKGEDELLELQAKSIAKRINTYNEQHGKLWRATVTELSRQPYNVRKHVLSLPDDCSSEGLEYYAGGIFDLGYEEDNAGSVARPRRVASTTTNPSPYVESFDWRNRHGKNWMTSVKHQGNSGHCWAFSSIAATEALSNLYFNQKLDLDLSEMDVAYYTYANNSIDSLYVEERHKYRYKHGGSKHLALQYIRDKGVIDDSSLPFIDDSIPGLPALRTTNYDELVRISNVQHQYFSQYDFEAFEEYADSTDLDEIKRILIKYGPVAGGFRWIASNHKKAHAMALVGYGVIHAGDSISYYDVNDGRSVFVVPSNSPYIGETYWIYKDSYGTHHAAGHDGYTYILYKNLWCLTESDYINTPITSINYTDDDIVVEDLDGDGYFNWGIGPKPAHCPAWAPDEEDGDDSDFLKGPMDEYGYCEEFPINGKRYIYIDNDTTLSLSSPVYNHYVIWKGATVTITQDISYDNGSKLIIDKNSTLIIDGATLNNVTLLPQAGSSTIIRNDGNIIHHTSGEFEIPLGATFELQHGIVE